MPKKLKANRELAELIAGRLIEMKSAGISTVRVIGSGNADECSACLALTHDEYLIEETPMVPPADCRCKPYCRCLVIAVS